MAKAKVVDKVIVTNVDVLKAKYGATGKTKLLAAVAALIKADLGRNIHSQLIDLSSATQMAPFAVAPIPASKAGNEQLNKDAIDAIFKKLDPPPQYLLILGSTDVVPHIRLTNPLAGDGDADVPSDLPYASAHAFSLKIGDFLRPTRVVGRLPNVTGDKKPDYLIGLLKHAAGYQQRPSTDFNNYLGITAQVWKKSTELSLDAVFGNKSQLKASPKSGPKWTAKQLGSLSHFINCHGAPADFKFYGQQGNSFPNAHDATLILGKTKAGCLVAAECCYGAELYDPALNANTMGICNTYLSADASGFFGSSTIAYGPAAANDLADLVCQDFLLEAIGGSSIGRACLTARLNYIKKKGGTLTQTDLKTLAQFNLMGDPSLTPVTAASSTHAVATGAAGAKSFANQEVARIDRIGRRLALAAQALAAPLFQLAAATPGVQPKGSLLKQLQNAARAVGITMANSTMLTSTVAPLMDTAGAKGLIAFAKSAALGPQAVHAVFEHVKSAAQLPLVRGFDAIQYEGTMQIRQFESR